jgi:hypothetical protein
LITKQLILNLDFMLQITLSTMDYDRLVMDFVKTITLSKLIRYINAYFVIKMMY